MASWTETSHAELTVVPKDYALALRRLKPRPRLLEAIRRTMTPWIVRWGRRHGVVVGPVDVSGVRDPTVPGSWCIGVVWEGVAMAPEMEPYRATIQDYLDHPPAGAPYLRIPVLSDSVATRG